MKVKSLLATTYKGFEPLCATCTEAMNKVLVAPLLDCVANHCKIEVEFFERSHCSVVTVELTLESYIERPLYIQEPVVVCFYLQIDL